MEPTNLSTAYQAEDIHFRKSGRQGSNLRHRGSRPRTLPTELLPEMRDYPLANIPSGRRRCPSLSVGFSTATFRSGRLLSLSTEGSHPDCFTVARPKRCCCLPTRLREDNVSMRGFEPLTPAMSRQCSSAELHERSAERRIRTFKGNCYRERPLQKEEPFATRTSKSRRVLARCVYQFHHLSSAVGEPRTRRLQFGRLALYLMSYYRRSTG